MKTITATKPVNKVSNFKNKLLSHGSTNSKTAKNQSIAESYILYLSPYKLNSFGRNVCGHASAGCAAACLNTAGMGKFSNVQAARQRKTDLFFSDPVGFLTQLYRELYLINAEAMLDNKAIAIRLNGTSDLDFMALFLNKLNKDILSEFTHLKFYDYTKNFNRAIKYLDSNYSLTFSRSEVNDIECKKFLALGGNVAVVFNQLPATYLNYTVINGDESDLRYLDPANVIVGLSAKGKAKKETSNFVINIKSL
jgi:hypothetical protein